MSRTNINLEQNGRIFPIWVMENFKKYILPEIIHKEGEDPCNEQLANELTTYQKFISSYLDYRSPFKDLLLYHGLGSGKTCSSIAIAEGIKNDKKILIMTPASLRDNYIEELKKCGDYLYKKNQYWEFINTKTHPQYVEYLSSLLKLLP